MGLAQGKSERPDTIQVQALLTGPSPWVWCRASWGVLLRYYSAGTPGRACNMGLVQGKSGRPATIQVQALLTGPAPWVWCRASRGVLLRY